MHTDGSSTVRFLQHQFCCYQQSFTGRCGHDMHQDGRTFQCFHTASAAGGEFWNYVRADGLVSFQFKRALLCGFNVASSIKTYRGLNVKFPIFLSNFNRIWMFSTDFYKRIQCQILRKSDADMTKVVGALHDRPGVKTNIVGQSGMARCVSCNWQMTHNLRYINKSSSFCPTKVNQARQWDRGVVAIRRSYFFPTRTPANYYFINLCTLTNERPDKITNLRQQQVNCSTFLVYSCGGY